MVCLGSCAVSLAVTKVSFSVRALTRDEYFGTGARTY